VDKNMPIKFFKSFLVIFCLSLSLNFLMATGCEKKMSDPKAALEKTAAQYWTQRLVDKDYQSTYEYELKENLPPFSTYEKQLKKAAKIPTSSVTAKDATIEGDIGIVTVVATCRIPGVPKEIPMPMRDRWILKGNQWKHYYEIRKKGKR
jgi:hypothetical protein